MDEVQDTIADKDINHGNVVQMKKTRGRPKGTGKSKGRPSFEERYTTRSIEEIASVILRRFELRYDEVLLRNEYREVEDGHPVSQWRQMRDSVDGRVMSHARLYARDEGADNLKSRECVTDAMRYLADLNPHHPVKAYLENCLEKFQTQTEAIDPLGALLSCFSVDPEKERLKVFLSRWLLGCVARIYDEGGHQNFMLVLLGDQGWGKSKFAEWLCSGIQDGKSRALFQEGQIRPTDKDHKLRLAKKWIWCVSELDGTTSKQDVAELKDFLTTETVSERPAYAKYEVTLPAICSTLGAVNVDRFLKDETGNRRFAPLPMTKAIDYRRYLGEVDIDLLWGQMMFLYQAGVAYGADFSSSAYPHHPTLPGLSAEERGWQSQQNEECFDADPFEEWLFQHVEVTHNLADRVLSHDLLAMAKGGEIAPGALDVSLQKKIAAALRRRSLSPKNVRLQGGQIVKGYSGLAWKGAPDLCNKIFLADKLPKL
jgi:hypothetical protein